MEVDVLKIQNISDENGYLEALGQQRIAEVKRDAAIGTAEAERDATIKAAQARQQGSVAQALADTAIAEAEQNRDVAKANFQAKVDAENARTSQAGPLADAQALRPSGSPGKRRRRLGSRRGPWSRRSARPNPRRGYRPISIAPAEAERAAAVARAEGESQAAILAAESARRSGQAERPGRCRCPRRRRQRLQGRATGRGRRRQGEAARGSRRHPGDVAGRSRRQGQDRRGLQHVHIRTPPASTLPDILVDVVAAVACPRRRSATHRISSSAAGAMPRRGSARGEHRAADDRQDRRGAGRIRHRHRLAPERLQQRRQRNAPTGAVHRPDRRQPKAPAFAAGSQHLSWSMVAGCCAMRIGRGVCGRKPLRQVAISQAAMGGAAGPTYPDNRIRDARRGRVCG